MGGPGSGPHKGGFSHKPLPTKFDSPSIRVGKPFGSASDHGKQMKRREQILKGHPAKHTGQHNQTEQVSWLDRAKAKNAESRKWGHY